MSTLTNGLFSFHYIVSIWFDTDHTENNAYTSIHSRESVFTEPLPSVRGQISLIRLLVAQTRCARGLTGSCSTPSSSSRARKTQPITTPVVTTRSGRSWWMSCWTELGSWQTSARDCRDSSSSTPSEGGLAPASHLCSWSASRSTTERKASSSSQSTQRHRWQS